MSGTLSRACASSPRLCVKWILHSRCGTPRIPDTFLPPLTPFSLLYESHRFAKYEAPEETRRQQEVTDDRGRPAVGRAVTVRVRYSQPLSQKGPGMHDRDTGIAREVANIQGKQVCDPVDVHRGDQPSVVHLRSRDRVSQDQSPPLRMNEFVVR